MADSFGDDIRLKLIERVVPGMRVIHITAEEAIALAHTVIPPAEGDLSFLGMRCIVTELLPNDAQ